MKWGGWKVAAKDPQTHQQWEEVHVRGQDLILGAWGQKVDG